jgi:nucleoside-diphosphate-sugar epimerase
LKTLITGGAGFIGSQIAEGLCRKSSSVVVLDNLSTGSLDNLSWRKNGDSLDFIEGDISDKALVTKLLRDCHCVCHHAAIASVPYSVDHPDETNRVNLNATLNLLIAARGAKIKRFVFASSSAVYGDSDASFKKESDTPRPLSPYALQKYAGEQYARMFYTLYGLETVSFRYFNVFGPRQSFNSPYSGVIAKFCTQLLAGKSVTVFGDGSQSRDFVAVHNVVNANLLAIECPTNEVAGQVFNIGTGQSITLLELLHEIGRQIGHTVKPEFAPSRSGDVKSSQADISLARERLGFDVSVSFAEGLKRTLDFYRSSKTICQ